MNIDNYKPHIINLKSDFYQLESKDKRFLQEYINLVMYDMIAGMDHQDSSYVQSSYNYLVTLIEFAIRQSAPVVELSRKDFEEEELEDLVVSMLDYYMDGIEGDDPFYKNLEQLTGVPEKQMRKMAHQNFWNMVQNAILSVRKDFPDFLEENDSGETNDFNDTEDLDEPDELDALDELDDSDSPEDAHIPQNPGDKIDYLNQISVQTAENCLSENLDKSLELIRQLYDNIRNDGFLLAKRRMEIMLFRLNVLKYYGVSERIGQQVDHRLYCMQTDEGAIYRLDVIKKLDQSFDRKQGQKSCETGMRLYHEGNHEKAAGYLKESALQGNPDGAFCYGSMLSEGIGCEKDAFTGAFWLWQAAQMGSAEAMVSLGVCYCNGGGVWHSKIRGLYYFVLAALHHNPTAIMNVGISLEQEDVIQGNAVLGRAFMRAAADLAEGPYSRAGAFVDANAKIILELTAEALQEREGGI